MIIIVDNGKGAQEISRFLRIPNKILKPKIALKEKPDGFILSDGEPKNLETNISVLEKSKVPVLGIATSCLFIGSLFGGNVCKMNYTKNEKVSLKKPCPLTTEMKKSINVVKTCQYGFSELPENFHIVGQSKNYKYEIIQEFDNPFFGVHFNPELGGDGRKIFDNFEKFLEVWQKYHK